MINDIRKTEQEIKICDTEKEYGFTVGDRVTLNKDMSVLGEITHIDTNLHGVTTCNVFWFCKDPKTKQWDFNSDQKENKKEWDIQWTNKLVKVNVTL